MTEPPLDPQREYEALAEALQIFQAQESRPTPQTLIALQQAVACATKAWQQCEPLRPTREKEFRYQVIRLKLLLAAAYQTLDAHSGGRLPWAA
jgi:hypothetical protein